MTEVMTNDLAIDARHDKCPPQPQKIAGRGHDRKLQGLSTERGCGASENDNAPLTSVTMLRPRAGSSAGVLSWSEAGLLFGGSGSALERPLLPLLDLQGTHEVRKKPQVGSDGDALAGNVVATEDDVHEVDVYVIWVKDEVNDELHELILWRSECTLKYGLDACLPDSAVGMREEALPDRVLLVLREQLHVEVAFFCKPGSALGERTHGLHRFFFSDHDVRSDDVCDLDRCQTPIEVQELFDRDVEAVRAHMISDFTDQLVTVLR